MKCRPGNLLIGLRIKRRPFVCKLNQKELIYSYMNNELQKKLKEANKENPLDEVVKMMLKSQAKSCVRAKVKLEQLEKKDDKK